eukprot:Hpha_TRINITY_DN15885_c0_g10::TRINITY_DN15885_c0_g10_i3::g.189512::m.189512
MMYYLTRVGGKATTPQMTRTGGAGGGGDIRRKLRGVQRRLMFGSQTTRPRDRLTLRGESGFLLNRCLAGSEDRDGNTERGARDVVQPHAVAELDRLRLTAVLTADTALQHRLGRPPLLHGHAQQLAHTLLVQHLEGVLLVDALLDVVLQEASRVVPRETTAHLRQVVRSEREELRLLRNLVGSHAGTRDLDHGPHDVVEVAHPALRNDTLAHLDAPLLHDGQLLDLAHKGDHDLRADLESRLLLHVARSLEDGNALRVVDLVVGDSETHTAVPEHRVELRQLPHALRNVVRADTQLPRQLTLRLLVVRHELVQRRVQQTDSARRTAHRLEDPHEVSPLVRDDLLQRLLPPGLVRSEDHLTHRVDTVTIEEHVLRTAQTDPLRTELEGCRRVLRRVRVRAHTQPPDLVRPLQDGTERAVQVGLHQRCLSLDHETLRPVQRDPLALAQHLALDRRRLRPVVNHLCTHFSRVCTRVNPVGWDAVPAFSRLFLCLSEVNKVQK